MNLQIFGYLLDVDSIYLAELILVTQKLMKTQNPSSWASVKTGFNP